MCGYTIYNGYLWFVSRVFRALSDVRGFSAYVQNALRSPNVGTSPPAT